MQPAHVTSCLSSTPSHQQPGGALALRSRWLLNWRIPAEANIVNTARSTRLLVLSDMLMLLAPLTLLVVLTLLMLVLLAPLNLIVVNRSLVSHPCLIFMIYPQYIGGFL